MIGIITEQGIKPEHGLKPDREEYAQIGIGGWNYANDLIKYANLEAKRIPIAPEELEISRGDKFYTDYPTEGFVADIVGYNPELGIAEAHCGENAWDISDCAKFPLNSRVSYDVKDGYAVNITVIE